MGDAEVLRGGQAFYGFDVGIILMENDTPRPVGDIGNARTWPFPVLYEVASGAAIEQVVEHAADGLLPAFVAAAKRLEACGVRAITTACGFVSIYQEDIAAQVSVPVATSSLLQVPAALRCVGRGRKVCVLTVNGKTLDERHLYGTGLRADELDRIVVVGMEDSTHLYPALVQGAQVLDVAGAEQELVTAARTAVAADDSIGAFVLECTNMPPYTPAIQQATGLPVWDTVTLVHDLHRAVTR